MGEISRGELLTSDRVRATFPMEPGAFMLHDEREVGGPSCVLLTQMIHVIHLGLFL
jgi:hypothetical protein